ncbi:DUF5926 family protein [Janibacter sp. GXQ6167]
MGKASRRKKDARAPKVAPAPYVARPFEGLPSETDWVAAHEILPAATAELTLAADRVPEGGPATVTLATVLPMAWAALRRDTGEVLIACQSGTTSGDASRDLAQAMLAALDAEPGHPIPTVPPATRDTPRLQDLLDTDAPFELTVHEGFDFWVGEQDLDGEARESLERANESTIPTVRLDGLTSAFWAQIGERTYIRTVLAEDEDDATNALARLLAAGESTIGDDTRLLGAFRAGGLLVPVWEVPAGSEPESHVAPLTELLARYETALAATEPLSADERRARSGLLSRQVTLR